jgi:uncharacterized protein YciI
MILCRDRPDSGALRQSTRPDHLRYMEPLLAQGRLRFAGPLLRDDAEGAARGSLIIADFDERAAAENWAAGDPYARAGLFAEVEITALRQALP